MPTLKLTGGNVIFIELYKNKYSITALEFMLTYNVKIVLFDYNIHVVIT